jgi:uncharacterized protein YbbC (DUF1343 family)
MRSVFIKSLCLLISILIIPDFASASTVKSGAEVLSSDGFAMLKGKRVGLITNQTAMVNGEHLADLLLRSKTVKLVALFGPEHGVKGLAEDGIKVANSSGGNNGVALYSLYGDVRQPTQEMLKGIDILLFDIQNIGARFYTYISTLGLAMQAAAKAGIPFVVLDRPNPLGGEYVAGPMVEAGSSSFVGLYPIPVAHGLTIGELAGMIKGERFLPGLEKLDLSVVKMNGWHRDMRWPATGLPWVKTSPNIPDFETALLYPGLCFFEATNINEGRGTLTPFHIIGAPRLDSARVAEALNRARLPGVAFKPVVYTPVSIPGMSSRPKYQGKPVNGVQLIVTDPVTFLPVETGMHMLTALYNSLDKKGRQEFFRKKGFVKLSGNDKLMKSIQQGISGEGLIGMWREGLERFRVQRGKYLLYR